MKVNYLSTGVEMLDTMLSGGYKKGSLTEISGVTDSGKTLLALKAVKETQKQNKLALYINANHDLTESMLKDNNIDIDSISVFISNIADTIAPLLSEFKSCIDDIGVIVIDDLASLTTNKEQNSSLNTNTDIHRSKVVKALLTRLSNLVRNKETCVLILNQERTQIIDNKIQGTVSSFEKWVNISCDTRIKLSIDEDGDSCVGVTFKERKL